MNRAFYLTKAASVADNGPERTLCLTRNRRSKVSTAFLFFCTLSGAAFPSSELVTNPQLSQSTAAYRANCPSPSPAHWEAFVGNSPLKLVVRRTWHDQHSFTDQLECGHESSLLFADFEWQDGHPINLQPTAKRRRCQKCAASITNLAGTTPQVARADSIEPCPPVPGSGRKQTSEKLIKGSLARVFPAFDLYSSALAETSLPPKKPCAAERGKKAA